MLFYKVETDFNSDDMKEYIETSFQRPVRLEKAAYSLFEDSCADMFEKPANSEVAFVFFSGLQANQMYFGVVCRKGLDVEKAVINYAGRKSVRVSVSKAVEVTSEVMSNMISRANRNDVLLNLDLVYENLGMEFLLHDISSYEEIRESVLKNVRSAVELKESARGLMTESLISELDRIFLKTDKKVAGHPVHYIICDNDKDSRREIGIALLEALWQAGRIQNKRYTTVNCSTESYISRDDMDNVYERNKGGAIIVCYDEKFTDDRNYKRTGDNIVKMMCEFAVKYKKEVLTVFSFRDEKIKNKFLKRLGNMCFVNLYTDVVFDEAARSYLRKMAKTAEIRPDKKLYAGIEKGKGFRVKDLKSTFDRWYDYKIKTVIYPQYSQMKVTREYVRQDSIKGSAIDELEKMIGLSNVKDVIKKALDYYKFQKIYGDMEDIYDKPSMHMVFTGNPGTAKTTVARLFARIMKDNDLLSVGDLYELGRADLVGKYVGHTAPLVQDVFREAKGSVLFIDEAYSLVDDKEGMYGDEAISTIVQEMENNRKDCIVIFAGYPDKMEKFLERNPGLRSRICFHVNFDDYSVDELCGIADLIASEKGRHITDAAMEKMRKNFRQVIAQKDFGNGRYVRNLIEQAKMKQASRLLAIDSSRVTKEMISTIEAEDIEIPNVDRKKCNPIGFNIS